MKTKRIITMGLLLLSLCFEACSNDDEGQDNSNVCLLFGKWVLGSNDHKTVLLFRSDGTGYHEYPLEGQLRHVDFNYTYKEEMNFPSMTDCFSKPIPCGTKVWANAVPTCFLSPRMAN